MNLKFWATRTIFVNIQSMKSDYDMFLLNEADMVVSITNRALAKTLLVG